MANPKAKTASKAAAQATAASATQTNQAEVIQTTGAPASSDDAASDVQEVAADFVEIGKDEQANADALQALLGQEPEFPLNLIVRNTVAMPFVLPLVPGFKLGHVAGDPEKVQRVVQVRSADQLQQVCLDIQDILTLNGLPGCIQMARTDAPADE